MEILQAFIGAGGILVLFGIAHAVLERDPR